MANTRRSRVLPVDLRTVAPATPPATWASSTLYIRVDLAKAQARLYELDNGISLAEQTSEHATTSLEVGKKREIEARHGVAFDDHFASATTELRALAAQGLVDHTLWLSIRHGGRLIPFGGIDPRRPGRGFC